MKDFLTALGLVMIIEGVPYFLSPERMREWMLRLSMLPEALMRRIGFIMMAFGMLLIYLVRQSL